MLLASIIAVSLLNGVAGQTGDDARALRTKLFETDKYDKKVRPAKNQSLQTEVYINFYLTNLNEVNEVGELMRTTGYLAIDWVDDYLTWTPASYGGINTSFWPQNDVWKPDIELLNSHEDGKELGTSAMTVVVDSTGTVSWSPFQVFQSTCPIDISDFPYDVQYCDLVFVIWSYSTTEVLLLTESAGINTKYMESNSEWDIIGSKVEVSPESLEASVAFTIALRRKPNYIMVTIFLPIVLLTILNLFVFVLPSDSGEKASYAITVFLTFVVFLTLVSSKLPENSETTSTLSIYIVFQTVQSTVITMITLLLVRLNSLDCAVPKWLQSVTCIVRCKRNKKTRIHHFDNNKVTTEELTTAADRQPSLPSQDEEVSTWKATINALDLVFFCVFLFIAILTTSLCIGILSYPHAVDLKPKGVSFD